MATGILPTLNTSLSSLPVESKQKELISWQQAEVEHASDGEYE